jgi:hypothetical protein|tara:strand:+ start:519 stop:788 length:270 start_codon:yes stop_codon:yes gene_type:complete
MVQNEDGTSIITAEWARETANVVIGKKVLEQISKCEDAVQIAVKKNEMSCNVFFSLESLTLKELTSRGFETKFNEGYDQRDSSYTTIKW